MVLYLQYIYMLIWQMHSCKATHILQYMFQGFRAERFYITTIYLPFFFLYKECYYCRGISSGSHEIQERNFLNRKMSNWQYLPWLLVIDKQKKKKNHYCEGCRNPPKSRVVRVVLILMILYHCLKFCLHYDAIPHNEVIWNRTLIF